MKTSESPPKGKGKKEVWKFVMVLYSLATLYGNCRLVLILMGTHSATKFKRKKSYKSFDLSNIILAVHFIQWFSFCAESSMQKSRIIHYDFLSPPALSRAPHLVPFLSQISTFKYSQKMISSIIHTLAWKHFFASLGYRIYGIKYQNIWKHCENAGKLDVVVYCAHGKMPKHKRNFWKIVIFLSHCSMKAKWIRKKRNEASEWIFLQISDWMLLRDFPSIAEGRNVND